MENPKVASYDLRTFKTTEELVSAAAREFLALVASSSQPAFSVALPGGRVAGQFFSKLAALSAENREALERVQFFWGDERCVPPDDPESNFGLARDRLLAPLGIPEARIHRIRGELAPDQGARQAAEELCALVPAGPMKQPELDLVLLGMGENGHVASLFPEEPEQVRRSPAVFRPVVTTKPPPVRVTLGYPAICAARLVWVLVSGPGKEAALRQSLFEENATPLGRVLALHPETVIWTDLRVTPQAAQMR